ncbi:uncharacterized protein LOC132203405 isoform X2 [Neocloeon triangulifer]|uniref:uncharacterized protein LOC132203405 isoform X2 n=1 Tax=Neocloeon triangulifer TaxID=2078957 RepID=UPI00286FA8FF|nr:uncharacterized protein LOC132203405 isoform X2 [Neocloeon triangulifer]
MKIYLFVLLIGALLLAQETSARAMEHLSPSGPLVSAKNQPPSTPAIHDVHQPKAELTTDVNGVAVPVLSQFQDKNGTLMRQKRDGWKKYLQQASQVLLASAKAYSGVKG